MNSVTLGEVFVKHYAVRRRNIDGDVFLVKLTNLCKLDQFSDEVWKLSRNNSSVFEITTRLSEKFPSIPNHNIIEKTLLCISQYIKLGYLVPESEALKVRVQEYRDATVVEYLAAIMQELYAECEVWHIKLDVEFKEKLITRFYRIMYEMYVAEKKSNSLETEVVFKTYLAGKAIFDMSGTVNYIKQSYDIKSWRHDVHSNSIVIKYRDTVYSGDVDSRL
ncbi:hypothetical protein [Saccharospirillum salsuginis]|uniref:Uncharacterized protein n=1 Tax=Saccharospirillum salsuginis TaxID=418750 RepID=A0A918NCH0_9GAMM|nr:hypothetical protein [Saccharospirillum salsuginis]GGX57654.1 hypothetical protein GCM10007392_26570 [Saccharospirillum salsuginis]